MFDILIIGAGPAGISLAAEARKAGIEADKIAVIEKMEEHSFSIKKYYPENKLVTANYKGLEARCTGVLCIPDLTKNETITYLDKAILANGLKVNYSESVWKIEKDNNGIFIIYTDKGIYKSRITAIAIGILGKPNKPDYKIPASLKNKVLFDITAHDINNADVLVVGGGDSASEYAQYLSQKGNRVTLSYRKKEFARMNDINRLSLLSLEQSGGIKILRASNISGINDKGGKPEAVFTDIENRSATYDYIVYALGGTTPGNFLKSLGIEFNGDVPILKENHETSVPGLFLLGDLAAGSKGGSIIWAFNSARNAINKICTDYVECSPAGLDGN